MNKLKRVFFSAHVYDILKPHEETSKIALAFPFKQSVAVDSFRAIGRWSYILIFCSSNLHSSHLQGTQIWPISWTYKMHLRYIHRIPFDGSDFWKIHLLPKNSPCTALVAGQKSICFLLIKLKFFCMHFCSFSGTTCYGGTLCG